MNFVRKLAGILVIGLAISFGLNAIQTEDSLGSESAQSDTVVIKVKKFRKKKCALKQVPLVSKDTPLSAFQELKKTAAQLVCGGLAFYTLLCVCYPNQ